MGKRSPRDTTPPDRIIDWKNEAERDFIIGPKKSSEVPWYDKLTGAAKDDFFGVPAVEPEPEPEPEEQYWWQKKRKLFPGLPHEFGLPRLPRDKRQSTLRIEGACFRKKYDESGRDCLVGTTPQEFHDFQEEQFNVRDDYNDTGAIEEFGYPRNTGFPGALTLTGIELLNALPTPTIEEEFEDLPISGAVFWLMKRAHKERLARLRKKRAQEEEA